MTDRPILFSGPMVRALIEGRKTQTRRVMNPQPVPCLSWDDPPAGFYPSKNGWSRLRYAVGDRLWVRETIDMGHTGYVICTCTYQADGTPVDLRPAPFWAGDQTRKLIPSIHTPRWASRLTLTVTEVRVQRLQDISEADAAAEGAYRGKASGRYADNYSMMAIAGQWFASSRSWYADLWDRINGAGSWEANPWVAAYTFTVEPRNIDAMTAEAARCAS